MAVLSTAAAEDKRVVGDSCLHICDNVYQMQDTGLECGPVHSYDNYYCCVRQTVWKAVYTGAAAACLVDSVV